jgi:hypothetical protein
VTDNSQGFDRILNRYVGGRECTEPLRSCAFGAF